MNDRDAAAEEMGGARSFFAAQMKTVVGIEIPINCIEGIWKLSQNRPEADRAGVVAGLSSPDDPNGNAAMAELMTGRGLR